MKYYLLLAVAIQIALNVDSLPFPAGQTVKYRVPSKYFNKSPESSDSLYNLLTQIHYGGQPQSLTPDLNDIQSEDISNDIVPGIPEKQLPAESTTAGSPETTEDVTELTQQMDVVKINDDSSLQALIEKVVNDEIKKLASDASEVIKLSSTPLLDVNSQTEQPTVDTTALDGLLEQEQTELGVTTEDAQLSGETTTNAPAAESEKIKLETISPDDAETLQSEQHGVEVIEEEAAVTTTSSQPDESSTEDEGANSESIFMPWSEVGDVVGDLLTSIFGFDSSQAESEETLATDNESAKKEETVSSDKNNDSISGEVEPLTTTTQFESSEAAEIEQSTDKIDEESTPAGNDGERSYEEEVVPLAVPAVMSSDFQDKTENEIDLKIENLAGFATETPAEQIAEMIPSESVKTEPEVLEVISVDEDKPTSFEESISHVMNLVKDTEGRLALESIGDVVDTILIDKHMKDDVEDLDQIVLGTLKEIETNLGLNGDADMPNDSFDPIVNHREDLMKKIETEINDSLLNKHSFDYDNFMPNMAKAALRYKHERDVDF